MADLRDREVAVSDKNDSTFGPSGKRKRSEDSLFLLVGGSKDVYDVTVNFETKNGHWCQTLEGNRCHGNGNGKGQKYGPPQGRDKHDPNQWCKHVKAALAATECLSEASDRTAVAFGHKPGKITVEVIAKPAVPAFEAPATDARARLAALEAEQNKLREEIANEEKGNALREAVAALIAEHGKAAVKEAVAA